MPIHKEDKKSQIAYLLSICLKEKPLLKEILDVFILDRVSLLSNFIWGKFNNNKEPFPDTF